MTNEEQKQISEAFHRVQSDIDSMKNVIEEQDKTILTLLKSLQKRDERIDSIIQDIIYSKGI